MKNGRMFRIVHYSHQTLVHMHKHLYLGLDAHTRNCVLAAMDPSGHVVSTTAFSTSEIL